MSQQEMDMLLEAYLTRFHEKYYKESDLPSVHGATHDLKKFIEVEKPVLFDQVQRCVQLFNLMWPVGTMLLLPPFEEQPEKFIGYLMYAKTRLDMYDHFKTVFK